MSPGADAVVARLRELEQSVACAESLTGGMLVSTLVSVPGASAVVRGGVVAYATDLKASVLGVDAGLLAAAGAVHPDVARQMASGVCRLTGSDWGLATTGVAGPDPQDGHPVGTVFIAACRRGDGDGRDEVRELALSGSRQDIREATATAALALLADLLPRP